MMTPAGPDSYYCAACPVCRGAASKADRGANVSEFHCGECGSFAVASSAVPVLTRKSPAKRMKWLQQVRARKRPNVLIAMLEESNLPSFR